MKGKKRIVLGVLGATFLIVGDNTSLHADSGVLFGDALQKFNQSEKQVVTDELSKRVPILALEEEDRQFANDLVQAGKTARTHAQNIAEEKYDEVGRALAEKTKIKLVSQIEERFEDPESPVRKMLSSVKDNPELYKKAVKAALDADPRAAATAIGDAINEHASSAYKNAVDKGKGIWKDAFNSVTPGGGIAEKFGTTNADVYAKVVEDWVETVEDAKEAKDTYVFDCLYRRYRENKRHGGSAAFDAVRRGLKGGMTA